MLADQRARIQQRYDEEQRKEKISKVSSSLMTSLSLNTPGIPPHTGLAFQKTIVFSLWQKTKPVVLHEHKQQHQEQEQRVRQEEEIEKKPPENAGDREEKKARWSHEVQ